MRLPKKRARCCQNDPVCQKWYPVLTQHRHIHQFSRLSHPEDGFLQIQIELVPFQTVFLFRRYFHVILGKHSTLWVAVETVRSAASTACCSAERTDDKSLDESIVAAYLTIPYLDTP